MKNDLHIRTNFSASAARDLNWEKVLQMCEKANIQRISITDFDTCVFHVINKIFDTSSLFSGKIITGMECDVCERGVTFELLAYNFEPFKTLDWSYRTYGTLEDRQTKIKDILLEQAQRHNINATSKKKFNGKVNFAHKYVYECLLEHKENEEFLNAYHIQSVTDFYILSTKNKNFPLYVNMNKVFPTVKKVVNFIHSVGGFTVLAQPCKAGNKTNLEFLLQTALKYGVDGVEVYHPSHTKEDIQYLLQFCKQHNLIVTGGSNFNGKPENNHVGIQNIDKAEKEILKDVNL